MTFKKMVESPVGQVGRTGKNDAVNHVTPELEKKFMKIVKELGGKTVARELITKMNSKSDKISKDGDETLFTESKSFSEAEDLLIKNNIKIKSKFSTKFGIEFILMKKYKDEEIKKALKDFSVTFDGDSIFVS